MMVRGFALLFFSKDVRYAAIGVTIQKGGSVHRNYDWQ